MLAAVYRLIPPLSPDGTVRRSLFSHFHKSIIIPLDNGYTSLAAVSRSRFQIMSFAITFLGVGNAGAINSLGNAAAVLLQNDRPVLLIDCGPNAVDDYVQTFGALPGALFITHLHLDHIGGMERLFYNSWFANGPAAIKLYVPASLVPRLHQRIGHYPSTLAEGGVNFWDGFHMIPVADDFWHQNLRFNVFPVRHHDYGSAYGLALRGAFFYSGDTRPVPELMNVYASCGETIFHDAALRGSPSHSGLDDIHREYTDDQQQRIVLYHLEHPEAINQAQKYGFRVARRGETIELQPRNGVGQRKKSGSVTVLNANT